MCGIAGAVALHDDAGRLEASTLEAMASRIVHRGPDDGGVWLHPGGRVGLASRRLSIVDLSPFGHQPMATSDGGHRLSYNGEIYNHLEIRRELQACGHRFRGHSDTETVLHLIQEKGAEALGRLRGIFGLAAWDEAEQTLLLARDRIGVKPLYWAEVDGWLVFSSEIKAILAFPGMSGSVDEEALYHYLTFVTTPAPQTLFSGIHKLLPGNYLVAGPGREPRARRYWSPAPGVERERLLLAEVPEAESWEFAVARVRERLLESIELRLLADVPVGVFLSGGVDSTSIVAVMREVYDQPIRTFSVGFVDDSPYDELDEARRVADHFGTEHHEVRFDDDTTIALLPDIIACQDEPLADPVCVPIYIVARLARETGTKVVQVGEGSDELFFGYDGFVRVLEARRRYWGKLRAMPAPLRHAVARLARPFLDTARAEALGRASRGEELFWGGAIAFWESDKRQLYRPERLSALGKISSLEVMERLVAERVAGVDGGDYLAHMALVELGLRLPELLLMRVDKMTMAHSVEARVPFLDHRLVELALAVPGTWKYRNGIKKHILREAVRPWVPDWVLERPKVGFCGSARNLLSPRLARYAESRILDSAFMSERFRRTRIEDLLRAHRRGRVEVGLRIWNLMNLAMWADHWL